MKYTELVKLYQDLKADLEAAEADERILMEKISSSRQVRRRLSQEVLPLIEKLVEKYKPKELDS